MPKDKQKRAGALAIVMVYDIDIYQMSEAEIYQKCSEMGYAWDEDAQVWVQEDALGRKVESG